tara:strand:- start:258 stop:1454 length:1197 start_codon:yes stop_codon:yes gene_type:complete
MAETIQRTLPAPFIEALGQTYADQLSSVSGQAIDTSAFAPQVAAQDAAQTQAYNLAQSGIGAYQPFLTSAAAQGTQAGTQLGLVPSAITAADVRLANVPGFIDAAEAGLGAAGTELTGAGTTLGGVPSFLTAAAGQTGPTAYQQYMSPYQQDIIDTTLTEFDRQRQAQQAQQAAATLGVPGAFGGGREGVLQAEYQTGSDRNRAALQAGLLQQGFTQAQGLAQQGFGNQLQLGQAQAGLAAQQANLAGQRAGLGQAQLGLGSAEQSLAQSALGIGGARSSLAQSLQGLGGFQGQLGQAQQGLQAQDIQTLGALGGINQAQAQAGLDAASQAARDAAFERQQRIAQFGAGVTGLMGGYPGSSQYASTPNPSALSTALGIGSTLAGIYGAVQPKNFLKFG